METAKIGGTEKGGVRRLTLTDLDRQVRDWFKAACEGLGCTVTVDEVGNMFAVRPGKRDDVAPIAMGSHFDTQPTGGKFDGILGVLGGLEALRTLVDLGYETNAPSCWSTGRTRRAPASPPPCSARASSPASSTAPMRTAAKTARGRPSVRRSTPSATAAR